MQSSRERLIEELNKYANQRKSDMRMDSLYICTKVMADFILADRKRIVEPLVKHKEKSRSIEELRSYMYVIDVNRAIDKTLKNAGVE